MSAMSQKIKGGDAEKLFEEIMAEDSSDLSKDITHHSNISEK